MKAEIYPPRFGCTLRRCSSAPRPAGSHLIIDSEGNFLGSVSGGCVESAVVTEAMDVIESGASQSPPLWRFNLTTIADETELLDTFAFFAKTEQISIEQQARSADADTSYGFFTDIEEIET